MNPRIPTRRRAHRVGMLLLAMCATACDGIFEPDDPGLPGTLFLERPGFASWIWLPGGEEILYGTPFDYPYIGPPSRLEALGVPGGGVRTVVAAPVNGDRIVPYRFLAAGAHVYFEASRASDVVALYRAPLTGGSAETVLDSIPYGASVSPDERLVAWVELGQFPPDLVTIDIESGERRTYPLPEYGDRIHWSPSGRSVVVEVGGGGAAAGTPFHWVDLESGVVRLWLAPEDQVSYDMTRHVAWEEETPFLYTTGDGNIARHSLATGVREILATAVGHAAGWSDDFGAVVLVVNEPLEYSCSWGGVCIRWRSEVDRVVVSTGQQTAILRHEGSGMIYGSLSPDGRWFAYEYVRDDGGQSDGIYLVGVR